MHAAGAGVIGEYDRCAFRAPGTGSFRGSAASNPTVGMAGAHLLNIACRTILNTTESEADQPFGMQVHDRRNFLMWRAASSERNWADPVPYAAGWDRPREGAPAVAHHRNPTCHKQSLLASPDPFICSNFRLQASWRRSRSCGRMWSWWCRPHYWTLPLLVPYY